MSVGIAPSESQERIYQAIERKHANMPCPRCGGRDFMSVNGYFSMSPGTTPEMTQMSGYSLTLVGMKCQQCGYLSFHDLNVLEHD